MTTDILTREVYITDGEYIYRLSINEEGREIWRIFLCKAVELHKKYMD